MTLHTPAPPHHTTQGTVRGSHSETLNAIKTFTVYTIADVFALIPYEIMWTSNMVNTALTMFEGYPVKQLPTPVVEEMKTHLYSERVADFITDHPHRPQRNVSQEGVDLTDWATAIGNIATECFTVNPIVTAAYRGAISNILSDLGVCRPHNARPSAYLPNALVYLKNSTRG